MRVHPLTKAMALAFCSAALVACGGDDNNDSSNNDSGNGSAAANAEVRVVHASSNAPDVNAGLDGGGQVSGLAYGNSTGFLEVPEGDYDVSVDGILPDGTTTNVISASGQTLSSDNETSIFAVGKVGSSSNPIEPLIVTAPDGEPASGNVRAQVVHASADAASSGDLDVYVTGTNTSLSNASPLGTFGYKGDLGPTEISGGEYRIRVTPTGSTSPVFDSGSITLSSGSDLLIAAIDNTGPANGPRSSPIRLLVVPEDGQQRVLVDQGAQAAVRAAHLSADAGSVDISVDGVNSGNPVVTGLTFDNSNFADNFTNFLALPEGQQTVNVEQSGSVVVSASPQLKAGERYTGYALGLANPSMSYQALSLEAKGENLRPVATEAKVRIVHAASQVPTDQGKVDIYVTGQSATVSDLDESNRLLDDVPFKAITDYLSVAPGSNYKLFVTAFNDETVAPIEANLPELKGGGIYTVAAVDSVDSNGNVTGVASSPEILVDNAP